MQSGGSTPPRRRYGPNRNRGRRTSSNETLQFQRTDSGTDADGGDEQPELDDADAEVVFGEDEEQRRGGAPRLRLIRRAPPGADPRPPVVMRTRRATAWGWMALFIILLAVVTAFWLGRAAVTGMVAVVVTLGVGSRLHLC